jgi:predicted DNA-binding protein YlxM (UPF0122 family)
MRNRTPKIPNDILIEEYTINMLSISQIAEKYKVPHRSVRRRLHILKIPIRYDIIPITLSKELLEEEYITNNLSTTKIAEKYNISSSSVYNKLSKYKIPIKEQCIDLIGETFGDLTVLEKTKNKYKTKSAAWLCKCKCGNIINATSISLRQGHTRSCGCSWKTAYEDIPGSYITSLKHGARIRDFEFSVSNEDLWNLFLKQNKKCALSGLELVFYTVRSKFQTASLDRIDPSKGYIKENIQWVHKDVNRIKMDLSEDRFLSLVKSIYEYRNI